MDMRVSGAVSTMASGPMTGPKSAKWVHWKVELLPNVMVMGWGHGDRWRPNWATVLGLVTEMFAPLSATLYTQSLSREA